MHNQGVFLYYVLTHLIATMSGVISLCIALYQAFAKREIESRVYFIVAGTFFFISCDWVWQDEHRNVETLISDKLGLAKERDFWKTQSYDKDASIRQRDLVISESQTSLTKLADKILDISKPEPQKFSTRADAVEYPVMQLGQRVSEFILTTNKPIEAKLIFRCDHAIPVLNAHIAGGGPHYPNSVKQIYNNAWQIQHSFACASPQF